MKAGEANRAGGRRADELRPVRLQRRYTRHAEGSVLVEFGDTRVLCTASVEDRVPAFLKDTGRGWVTAEYGMLPRSTNTRTEREAARGKQSGRTQEIQRLIGRSLRSIVDLASLGPRTVQIDCDVLQADGGTRTAAITGAFVALHDAFSWLKERTSSPRTLSAITSPPYRSAWQGHALLDLDYAEDSACGCDMNVVMTGRDASSRCRARPKARRFRAPSWTSSSILRRVASPNWCSTRKNLSACEAGARLVKPGKLREIGALLAPLSIELVSQESLDIPEADEPHATFLENALAKARHASRASGLAALADDSGLCVESLGGEPGVHSAYYAGREGSREERDARNNRKLLSELDKERKAYYCCVLVMLRHPEDPRPLVADGIWRGEIARSPRGANGLATIRFST